MSDPMNRPANPPPDKQPTGLPPSDEAPRKSASPLIWILLLIAVLAFGWYFYNQRGVPQNPVDATATPATTDAMTPAPSSSAEREPARRTAPAKPATPKPVAADRDPRPIARVEPTYPVEAFRAREEGLVLVRADIDASGNATNVEVARRSGSRDLDRAATDAVRKWRFEPAIKNGKAVASTVQVPVEFKLDRQ
jgi:protein TonB